MKVWGRFEVIAVFELKFEEVLNIVAREQNQAKSLQCLFLLRNGSVGYSVQVC